MNGMFPSINDGKFYLWILLILVVFFSSCVSRGEFRVEPENQHAMIAVGRVSLIAESFPGGPFSRDKAYDDLTGVQLFFINSEGEEFIVKTRRGYYFLTDHQIRDSCSLKKIYYKESRDEEFYSFEVSISQGAIPIKKNPGALLNLGVLKWHASGDKSVDWKLSNEDFESVENWFREDFYESGWTDGKWVSQRIISGINSIKWSLKSQLYSLTFSFRMNF